MKSMTHLLALVICLSAMPDDALADTGDMAIGTSVSVGSAGIFGEGAVAFAPRLDLRVGLLDWLHLDGSAGLAIVDGGSMVFANAELGLTAVLDVFTWVPEFKLSALVWARKQLTIAPLAGLQVRYHFDARWSWAFGGAVGPQFGGDVIAWVGAGSLSVLYSLD